MKKVLLKIASVVLALLIFQFQTIAGSVSGIGNANETDVVAQFDESEIYNSFNEVNDLVSFISENENATYDELNAVNSDLLENVSTSAAIMMNTEDGVPPFLSAFWWGCIFSWVGVLVVYMTTDNNSEYMRPAWRGCFISAGCQVLTYAAYYAYVAWIMVEAGSLTGY
jgi:hypothetical protein